MIQTFASQIASALGTDPTLSGNPASLTLTGTGTLPSCFATSDLAVATVAAAAGELAALTNRPAQVNRRHALMWFDMTLRPEGWDLPDLWDPVAGDYQTRDGWIRLHTNAPHHRTAALSVLRCDADRTAVAARVAQWDKTDLETAIVAAHGCAAAMHSQAEWAAHPQGQAVQTDPLIHWTTTATDAPAISLDGLKILDLTRVLAGPVATRFLAGFGAQVLRIDPPTWDEPGVIPEVTLGKRCAGLDLKRSVDRQTFEALLAQADVLVHGYRRDALPAMGYACADLRKLAPHLIDVSLNAYGQSGPWANRRGFDSLVQMSSGIAATGMVRRQQLRPKPLPVQALDHGTGYLMAAAVLRAVRRRNATGDCTQARLSLARTAAMLVEAGDHPFEGAPLDETAADLSDTIEATDWGPARRVAFPVRLGDAPCVWPTPAGHVRRHHARWLD